MRTFLPLPQSSLKFSIAWTVRGKNEAYRGLIAGQLEDPGQGQQETDLEAGAKAQSVPVVTYRDSFAGKTIDRPGFTRREREIAARNMKRSRCGASIVSAVPLRD
ncbi:MAG: hypothetical protein JO166_11045 [Deltaproteobacteria bacterium]|nr:hypothetical protein [Deltaproteobacteria bacterium]